MDKILSWGRGSDIDAANMMLTIERERELEMVNVFRNIMVAGALMGFARWVARDKRIVG